MLHRLDWSDLQYVLAVAREGSLAAAARELGVNHATVQRRILSFEDRHGVRLFERLATGYRPVPDAAQILADLEMIGDNVGTVARGIAGQAGGLGGPIHLTTTDTLSSILSSHVTGFQNKFPDAELTVSLTNSRLDFSQMDADLALRPAAVLPEDLDGLRIGKMTFKAYGRAGDAWTSDWLEADWIVPAGDLLRAPAAAWVEENVSQERVTMRCNSFLASTDAVLAGAGVAVLPCCLVQRHGDLRVLSGPDPLCSTDLWIAMHRDMLRSSRMMAFREFFATSLSKDRGLLEGRVEH